VNTKAVSVNPSQSNLISKTIHINKNMIKRTVWEVFYIKWISTVRVIPISACMWTTFFSFGN